MKKTYAAVLAVIAAIVFTGGCQEEQVSSDVNMHRLIAMENKDLKAQLQQETSKRDEEIKNLKTQLQTETKKRDDVIKNLEKQLQTEKEKLNADVENLSKQLAKCTQTTDEKMAEDMKKYCEEQVTSLMDWNTELVAENELLKTELDKIKGEPAEPQSDANKEGPAQ